MSSPPSMTERELADHIARVRESDCPRCGRGGPVDLHSSYWVWSAVVVTSRKTSSIVACRRCGDWERWKALGSAALVGWWGFPFGLIFTPIQIFRNVIGLLSTLPPDAPSRALEARIREPLEQSGRAPGMRPCPHCGVGYRPDDYREDAERILCRHCDGELPRG